MIKKVFISVILVFAGINICQAEMIMPSQSIENEVLEVERPSQAYNMMSRIKKDRNTIYNVLNLTPEQICKMTEIEQERYKEKQKKIPWTSRPRDLFCLFEGKAEGHARPRLVILSGAKRPFTPVWHSPGRRSDRRCG